MNDIEEEFGKLSPTQEEPIDSDSDSSSDPKRKSPPTQVQSLSEESSGGSSRRNTKSSPLAGNFVSSDSDPEVGEGQLSSRAVDDFGRELGQVITRKGSRAHLLHSDADYEDILQVQCASNPYVRVSPNTMSIDHQAARSIQSLDLDEDLERRRARQLSGCDSDSTLDRPLPSGSPRRRGREARRQTDWAVGADQEADLWSDNVSIITDGGGTNSQRHTEV